AMLFSSPSLSRWLAFACVLAMLGACNATKSDAQGLASASAAAAAASASASSGARTSASSAPAGPAYPAEWTDLDLTPAGKVWAEYTLKGPTGAKVKKGFPDPSIE